MADPHSTALAPADKKMLPSRSDTDAVSKYVIGTVQRKTRTKVEKHVVSAVAWCTCGWSSPTHTSNSSCIDDIWKHVR